VNLAVIKQKCENELADINHQTVKLIAQYAITSNKTIHISTDYVFDGTSSIALTESKTQPINVYGSTKEQERACKKQSDAII
jgi:dTDP-4-dehydrorhamnose reductase